jgi:hypothetical protein
MKQVIQCKFITVWAKAQVSRRTVHHKRSILRLVAILSRLMIALSSCRYTYHLRFYFVQLGYPCMEVSIS